MHSSITRNPNSTAGRRKISATTAGVALAAGMLFTGTSGIASAATGAPVMGQALTKTTAVPITGYAYTPASVTVKLGEMITWTNMDAVPHTVTTTSAPVKFDSGTFEKGKSFSYTFTKAGIYKYYCAVHPEMAGEVIVLDKDGKPAAAEAPAEPAANPLASLLGPLLPKSSAAHSGMSGMSGMPTTANPDPDPTAEHTPGVHGDNTAEGAAAGTSDNVVPSGSSYPYQAAADPVSGAGEPFMAHLEAAHFSRGAGGQVQDIAEFDSWGKSHEFLLRQMTEYEQGKDSVYGTSPVTGTFAKHLDNAHYNTSPLGQVSAIANFDSWNKSHLALFRAMFDPFVGRDSALGTAPAAGVFMQHLDAAHWNTSVNGQATAISDDFPAWLASHEALAQAMLASGENAITEAGKGAGQK